MHLVFATSIVPDDRASTGYEIATNAVIDALRRAGTRVTVIGFTWPGRPPADPAGSVVLGALDVRTEAAGALRKAGWLAAAFTGGLTLSSAKLRIVPDRDIAAALRAIGHFDAYVVNAVQFAGAFPQLLADRPSIFVAHNVEHLSAAQNAVNARSRVHRMLYAREARLLKRLEDRLCGQARYVFTFAEEDRQALGVPSQARSAALPLVAGRIPPVPAGPREISCEAALIGTWTWQPNRVGLEWFLDQVVPQLGPQFRIRIAGQVPADLAARHRGVTFVGRVPDAVEFVRSGAVVPLISRAGTGVQLKTIETFQLGLPSVATTSSLRGITHVPSNCVVADDPAEFARALEAAVRHPLGDIDGTDFFIGQRALFDTGIRRGLNALTVTRPEVPA